MYVWLFQFKKLAKHSSSEPFYTRDASSARVLAIIACLCVCVCLSVCVCVTRRYCIKTAKRRITQTTPRDSAGTVVFWRQESLVDHGWPPSPWNSRSKLPTPCRTPKLWPIYAHSASTMRASEKGQLALIACWPRAFQLSIDEPCTLPLSPQKGGTMRDFAIFFPVNFNTCR